MLIATALRGKDHKNIASLIEAIFLKRENKINILQINIYLFVVLWYYITS